MFRRLRKLFGFESRLAQRERLSRRARPAVECLEDRLTPSSFTYTVPDGNVSNIGSGTTGGLVWAINQTNSDHHTQPDTINLASSSNYLFSSSVNTADGPTALPSITSQITINGNGSTISGLYIGICNAPVLILTDFRLFDVSSSGALALNDMTLMAGQAIGSGNSGSGGAIFSSGSLDLQDVTVSNNAALGSAGVHRQNGNDGSGGAIYIAQGTATLTDTTLNNNRAVGGSGAGGPTGYNSLAPSGGQGAGGGLYVNAGLVTLSDDTLSANSAVGGVGGNGANATGYTAAGGNAGNGGPGVGGGLYVNGGAVTLVNDTIADNSVQGGAGGNGGNNSGLFGRIGDAGSGGISSGAGIYVSGGTVNLTNDTIAYNNTRSSAAGEIGGNSGIGLSGGASGNTGGGTGGGLYVSGGTVNLTNTLSAENTDQAGAPDVWGTFASAHYDLIGDDNAGVGLDPSTDILNPNYVGIGTLQDNGGPTQTIALLPAGSGNPVSPAIDAGNDSLAPSATDQRGDARITGQHIDIGAYEYAGTDPAAADLSVAMQAFGTATPGGSLTYTITVTNNSTTTDQNNVDVADVLPANTTFGSWSVPPGWDSAEPSVGSSGAVSAWIGTLPADTSATFTLTVNVSGGLSNGTQLSNTATVAPVTDDVNPANNSVTVATSVVTALPTQLVFLQPPKTTTAGQALNTVQVVLEDGNGNPVTGDNTDTIALIVQRGANNTPTGFQTSAEVVNGVATFTGLELKTADSYTLAAEMSGLPNETSPSFTVKPAAVTKMAFSGTIQSPSDQAGTALGSVQVSLLDQYGNVETGINSGTVSIALASGPGSFTATSTKTVTISGGKATFSNLVLDTAGTYKLQATTSLSNLSAITSPAITVNTAAASKLVFTTQPSSGTAGVTLPAVTVCLEDKFGNVITSDSSDLLTLAITSHPNSSATATLSKGVVTFSHLKIVTAGSYTLTASTTVAATGKSLSMASTSFTISPAVAAQLVFQVEPGTATAGQKLPTVKVAVEDQYGNVETGLSVFTVTLAIASGPGQGAFTANSTTTVVFTNGVAVFNNLVLDTAGNYVLEASSSLGTLSAVKSTEFTVNPAAASKLAFTLVPTGAITGTLLQPLRVAVEDRFGNIEQSDSTDSVALSIASGPAGGSFTANSTLTATVHNGIATFSNLELDTIGTYHLKAVSGTLASATSPAVGIAQTLSSSAVSVTSGSITPVAGKANEYQQTVTIKNISGATMSGPLSLRLTNLGQATVSNKTGTFVGNPYLDFLAVGHQLAANQSVSVTIIFIDTVGTPSADYTAQVLRGI